MLNFELGDKRHAASLTVAHREAVSRISLFAERRLPIRKVFYMI